jgi:hypothetical protein
VADVKVPAELAAIDMPEAATVAAVGLPIAATLLLPARFTITMAYSSNNGTALAGADCVATGGTLTKLENAE